MEVEGSSGSGMYRPRLDDVNRSCDGIAEAAELPSVDGCHPIDEMDDSQLVGVPAMGAVGSGDGSWGAPAAVVKAMVKDEEGGGGKRKRGRPPKGQPKPPPVKKMKDEEEDVCFICFDGGSLVLCDRRGCPKAYHPACIKRDEAFFRSRAKWNCGWHICSICQKAAHYMCYTCTYSLCKACTKFADYLCVRENKGFCTTCMRTILLIENNDNGNKEMAQVDFDDKSSWEYLFKVYWIYLKGKLCLTLDELSQAKNPWKAAGLVACNSQSSDMHYGGNDSKVSISDSFYGHLWTNDSKKRTEEHAEQPKLPSIEDSQSTGKSSTDEGTTSTESTEWASKELLELVAHMTNGDTSILSQFDVQGLLLEYIKRYNLRDPRRKSQIICDSRLKILFGRPRVGHFEMLKLLEFHFLIKEDSKKEVVQGNIVDAVLSQTEGGGNNENLLMMGKDKKRKSRRKGEERGPQTNLNEFAAIDVHNINLVYLRRNLMESLIACNGKFHEKVVGSVVRIRISSSDQKQDMYRLVQVVGTCKVAIPYKIGEKTADVVLEILNLDKKETVSIDTISNQEFSEDECKRLRQSIKCGLVKRLTVGQVQDKAMVLQEVRLNDWLETEVLRLNHLRDRASEKGRKKELRECVEKLELLKTPEERQRRLREIPEVHADPNMDPKCESDEDAGEVSNEKQDGCAKPRYPGFSRNGRVPISPRNGGSTNDFGSRAVKRLPTYEQSRSKGAPIRVVERAKESSWHEGKDALGSNCLDKPVNRVDSSGSVVGGWNNQAVLRSGIFSGHASEPSIASLSTESAPSANDSETNKLWHYRDPSGKIQGPFCMVQLRKWSTTGYFPPDMRIWSIDDEEVDSVLLTDVLNGKFHKVLPSRYNVSLPSQQANVASDCRDYCDDKRIGGVNTDGAAVNHSLGRWNCNGVAHSNGNNEFVRGGGCGSHSSNLTPPVVNNKDVLTGRCNNAFSDLLQVHSSLPSSKCVERQNETCPRQGRGDNQGEMRNCSPSPETWKSHGNSIYQTPGGHINANRSDCLGYSGHSSGETRMDLLVNLSSNNWKSNHGFASGVKSADSSDLKLEIDIPNLPSPTPRTRNGDLEGQTTKEKRSLPSNVPVRDLGIYNLPSPTPKPNDVDEKADSSVQHQPSPPADLIDGGQKVNSTIRNLPSLSPNRWDGDEKVQTTVSKPSVSSNVPVQDSGPSRSTPSSLAVGGGIQHPETADEWGRSSTTSTKPSAEEWDSGLASVSSIKLPEVVSDHAATPTSGCDQLSPPSPLRPANNASSWKETITEPIEFSTLDEESVSDLLAEVDAMESQCGPASPTSVMYSGDELFQDTRNDCFTSFDGLSPQPDSGKSDALSSTGDIQLRHQQLSVTEEPLGASQADVKRCDGLASTSTEVGVERRDTDVSVNQTETGSSSLPAPSTLNRETVNKDSANGAGPTSLNTDWGATQGKTSLGLEVTRGMANVGWGTSPGMARANANTNGSTLAGVMGRESQPKNGGERFIGARDGGCQSGDLGFGRVRQTWSRQSSFGGGGSGSGSGSGGGSCYSRPPPKGQRVCKFYESGHCKKGAFCEYLHP